MIDNSNYIGLDPGSSSGALAVMGESLSFKLQFNKCTDIEIMEMLETIALETPIGKLFCFIENVHAFPGQGVVSTFKFGDNNGMLRGFLIALRIPFERVSPQKWQKYYNMKKDKNESKPDYKKRLKQRAQELFPQVKVTANTADAILIANYCREMKK